MVAAATLPWPRSLLPLRAAAAAREYHSIKSKTTFAASAAAPMATSPKDDLAVELLAKDARARAPSECWSCFEPPAVLAPASSSSLPLSGLTFASKEMYDIAGHEPAFGSPAYREWKKKTSNSSTPSPSTSTAPVVAALVARWRHPRRPHHDERDRLRADGGPFFLSRAPEPGL